MQKIVTRIFIGASLAFGVIGIIMVLTSPTGNQHASDFNRIIEKLLMITAFIILPSFALSVASKYLGSISK